MNIPNVDSAWSILIERKVERKDSRIAYIAALIFERVTNAESALDRKMSISMAAQFAAELTRLAVSIKALCEASCNYELSKGQETRLERLEARFEAIAKALGFEARTGGDPRGACAYLIDPDNRKGDGWGEGWAVYA